MRQIDIALDEAMLKGEAINFVNGCGVSVARKEFLFSIGEDLVRRELFLGQVFDSHGKQFYDLVTFRGKCRIIVRGHLDLSYRYCSECGQLVYYTSAVQQYLYPPPPPQFQIFDGGHSGIVLTEMLFQRVELTKWKNLAVDELRVAVEPKDLLGNLAGSVVVAETT